MQRDDMHSSRLKVSQKIAHIVGSGAPRDVQMAAARGALPLPGRELLTVLLVFCAGRDLELRQTAAATLKQLPMSVIRPVLGEPDIDAHLLELVARVRGCEEELAAAIIIHPKVRDLTLLALAKTASSAVLERLANHQGHLDRCPQLVQAILENPRAERALKFRLGWQEPVEETSSRAVEDESSADSAANEVDDLPDEDDIDEEIDEGELSKYQMSLSLSVSEKIKMGLTGDKEWRGLLIKDANKLVQGAVMKNPRITDAEVIAISRNKQSSDEMIRLILLNKDWMKLYEIKRALVVHPKTPLPKALRMVPFLSQKDLKDLARSRNVQTVLSTAARKEIERKQKRS